MLFLVIAFALRLCSIWANLPSVSNPDEFKLVWPPLRMAYGTWYAGGGYPPLYMYVLLVQYGVYYGVGALAGQFAGTLDFARRVIADPTPLYLMGRMTSVLLGVATVALMYAVGRRLYNSRVGLLAAAFLTFDTVHVYASQVVKNDVLMVFLLVAALWFACGIMQMGRTRDYAFAGLSVGLATAAKYNALAGALLILSAHLLYSRVGHKTVIRSLTTPRLWLAGLCTLSGFLLGYPHFVFDPGLALEGLRTNSVGFFWAWLGWEGVPLGWIYYPVIALNTAWGLPLQLLALGGVIAALIRRQPANMLLLVMPVVNYVMMGGVRVNQPRYFLLAMPCLLLLAARFLVDVWDRVGPAKRVPVAVFAVVVLVLITWPAAFSIFQDVMLLQPDPRVTARQWIAANLPAGCRVVVDMGAPSPPASPESQLAYTGPPKGFFERLARELAANQARACWVLPIQHYVNGEGYQIGREATVEALDWYKINGYRYFVISNLFLSSYQRWPGVAGRYPNTMAFYRDLPTHATLLAEFTPVIADPREDTATDMDMIPTIRVYRLD